VGYGTKTSFTKEGIWYIQIYFVTNFMEDSEEEVVGEQDVSNFQVREQDISNFEDDESSVASELIDSDSEC